MAESGATPKDYGLKVQSHPVLMVTSPLKMRSATPLFLSYSGSLVQTVAMHKDSSRLRSNLAAADRLLSSMGSPTTKGPVRERDDTPDQWRRSFLWERVGSEAPRLRGGDEGGLSWKRCHRAVTGAWREHIRSVC